MSLPITPIVNFKTKTKTETNTKTKTKTEFLKDPTYAIFLENMGFKDIKYNILTIKTRPEQIRTMTSISRTYF